MWDVLYPEIKLPERETHLNPIPKLRMGVALTPGWSLVYAQSKFRSNDSSARKFSGSLTRHKRTYINPHQNRTS